MNIREFTKKLILINESFLDDETAMELSMNLTVKDMKLIEYMLNSRIKVKITDEEKHFIRGFLFGKYYNRPQTCN